MGRGRSPERGEDDGGELALGEEPLDDLGRVLPALDRVEGGGGVVGAGAAAGTEAAAAAAFSRWTLMLALALLFFIHFG